jgi:hypothetical protein
MRPVGKILLFFLLQMLAVKGWSQSCTALGQNPNTAFPVCGATTFVQTTVPLCNGGFVPAINCNEKTYNTANPYWYKFTCYVSGTLGFVITPLNTVPDDYDWQLFDITGHDPMEVYTNRSMIVSANWAGVYGPTGASSAGKKPFGCSSTVNADSSTFASMPFLIQGHEYLLVISHYLNPGETSEVGYKLNFGGGTASIVNPVVPIIQSAYGVCDGTQIVVKLSKKVKCSSLAADGSDFSVSGTVPISIKSALGNGCSSSFDMDSVVLTLNNILVPGTYKVTAKVGSDGNTLIDNCDNTSCSWSTGQPEIFTRSPYADGQHQPGGLYKRYFRTCFQQADGLQFHCRRWK